MTVFAISTGSTLALALPQWLARERQLPGEVAGQVLRVTPRAVLLRVGDADEWFPLDNVEVVQGDDSAAEAEARQKDRERWARADAYLNDPVRLADRKARLAAMAPPPNPHRVEFVAGAYRVMFPFTNDLLAAMRRVPGVAWREPGKDPAYPEKHWRAPEASGADVLRFAAEHGFEVSEEAAAQGEAMRRAAERNLEESRAASADFEVQGLGGTLRPFQGVGVGYQVRVRRFINADQMRLGKTVQSLATLPATDAYPALFIVPATLKPNWRREALRWLPGRNVVVLDGKSPRPPQNWVEVAPVEAYGERCRAWRKECLRQIEDADVAIINYDILMDWAGVHWGHNHRGKRSVEFCDGPLAEIDFRALFCDEFHKHIIGRAAQRTMVIQYLAHEWRRRAAEQGFDMVQGLLSGTPMKRGAVDLLQPLQIIDRLDDLGGWHHYATRYCGYANGVMGSQRVPPAALESLNQRLRSVCMVRRRRSDVFSEIPKKQRNIVPFAIDNRAEYERAERDVVGWYARQAVEDREFAASLEGLSAEERKARRDARAQSAAATAMRAEGLVRISALKRLAARGKMAGVAEWVGNFLEESGEKIILAAWHQDIVEELAKRFDAPFIHGGVSGGRKDQAVTRFQRCVVCGFKHEQHYRPAETPGVCGDYTPDPKCSTIVINFESGGMGLTLTAASDIAIVELGWTPDQMDQVEARVEHIDKMDPANNWYLLAEGTIEEDIAAVLDERRLAVDAATDGVGREESHSIMADLMERISARAGA